MTDDASPVDPDASDSGPEGAATPKAPEAGSPAAPAGWYPVEGAQRYWDGSEWTEHVAPAAVPAAGTGVLDGMDPKSLAMLTHLMGIFFGFIPSLIVYLVKRDDPFVRFHAAQALNFEITLIIAYTVAAIAIIVLIGLLLLPLIFFGSLAIHIVAGLAANRGEYYRIPFAIPLFS